MNESHLEFFRMGDTKFLRPPYLEPMIDNSHLMARKKLSHFFMQEIDLSPIIFIETDKLKGIIDHDPRQYQDWTVYEHRRGYKAKVGLPQLTLAR